MADLVRRSTHPGLPVAWQNGRAEAARRAGDPYALTWFHKAEKVPATAAAATTTTTTTIAPRFPKAGAAGAGSQTRV